MNLYECRFPNCGGDCGQTETPHCRADHENEVAELHRRIGEQMVKMTTTVWSIDEWLSIPYIWQEAVDERDRLQALVQEMKAELSFIKGEK